MCRPISASLTGSDKLARSDMVSASSSSNAESPVATATERPTTTPAAESGNCAADSGTKSGGASSQSDDSGWVHRNTLLSVSPAAAASVSTRMMCGYQEKVPLGARCSSSVAAAKAYLVGLQQPCFQY